MTVYFLNKSDNQPHKTLEDAYSNMGYDDYVLNSCGISYSSFPGCCGAIVISNLTNVNAKELGLIVKQIIALKGVTSGIKILATLNTRQEQAKKVLEEFGFTAIGRTWVGAGPREIQMYEYVIPNRMFPLV